MRVKTNHYYVSDVMHVLAANLYEMAPLNRPRNADAIMNYMVEKLESACVNKVSKRWIAMTSDDFGAWLKSTLMEYPEFQRLNLTQDEIDAGITDIDDDSRAKFKFVSAHDVETENSWRTDFIDLCAYIQNVIYEINKSLEETDCFLCDYEGTEVCSRCALSYENQYSHANTPFGKDKFDGWCDTSCHRGIAVCCCDCDKYSECTEACKCVDICKETCPQYVVKEVNDTHEEDTNPV